MRLPLVAASAMAWCAVARAATISAESAEYDAVAHAIRRAGNGDTVAIPAGDATWPRSIGGISRTIHIQGAGIGRTIIRRSGNQIISWAANRTASIDGVEFHLTWRTNSANILIIHGRNDTISRCKFVGETSKVVGTYFAGGRNNPHPTGVVWGCSFVSARALVSGDIASGRPHGFGRYIWADADDVVRFGMADTVFFEDNTFDLSHSTGNVADDSYGGHYVFRHNTVIHGGVFGHGASGDGARGGRMIECYDNVFDNRGMKPAQDPAVRIRGGAAVVYNNTITGDWGEWGTAGIEVDSQLQRYGNDLGDGNAPLANGTGTHTGGNGAAMLVDYSQAWLLNAFVRFYVYNLTDGSKGRITANTATTVTADLAGGKTDRWSPGDAYKITNGYPLRDQPGRGRDSTFWAWGRPGPAQALEPVYEWNNTMNGQPIHWTVNSSTWIQKNRDVYDNTPMPGYTAYPYPHPLRAATAARAGRGNAAPVHAGLKTHPSR